jgi:hypothetical protein
MKYEWDEDKATVNLSKHGVTFEEAKTAFNDPLYVDFYDPDHSYGEHRYILIGSHIKDVYCLFRTWNVTMSFG